MRSRFFSSTRHLGAATTTATNIHSANTRQQHHQPYAPVLAIAAGAFGAVYMINETDSANAKALPIYKRAEIAKHNTEESLWVHYEG